MKHVIFVPNLNEVIPEGSLTYDFNSQYNVEDEAGNTVRPADKPVKVVVAGVYPDDTIIAGDVLYECVDGVVTRPLAEGRLVHTFAGWPS